MEWLLELLKQAGYAMGSLLLPLYVLAVAFIVLLVSRQIRAERRLFYVRLTTWAAAVVPAMTAGLAAGAVVSAIFLFLGVSLGAEAVYWLWGVSLILMLLRIRFLGFIYAAGVVGMLQWTTGWFEWQAWPEPLASMAASLEKVDAGGVLLLAGLLLVAEAALMRWRGNRAAGATFVEGKRGRLVGGYQLFTYWPVPLLLLVPGGADAALPWVPLLWQDGAMDGWSLLGLPVVIGFSAITTSVLPREKARRAAGRLALAGLAAAGTGAAAALWSPFVPLAALAAPILHEIIHYMERKGEEHSSPRYVHDTRGLLILAVTPNTPAAQLGIEAGEILHKVNGVRVTTREDLYNGLLVHSAFCKLEVYNLEGQLKFLQRARFEGEHHELGIVFAPDEATVRMASGAPGTLLDLLRRGSKPRRSEQAQSPASG